MSHVHKSETTMTYVSQIMVLDSPDHQCRGQTGQLPKYKNELVGETLQKSQDTGLCRVSLKYERSSSPCILQISSSNKWRVLDDTAQPQRSLSVYEFEVKKYEWSRNSPTMEKSKTTPQWSSVPRETAAPIAMTDVDGNNPKCSTDFPVKTVLQTHTQQLLKIARYIVPKSWSSKNDMKKQQRPE